MSWLTGGADGLQGITMGPILGLFEFDIFGTTAYAYSLVVTFLLFVIARRIVVSPYRAVAARDPRQSSAGPRRRHPGQPQARRGLHPCRRLCGRRRRAAGADDPVRLARRACLPPLRRRDAGSGDRRRRLSLWRPDRRRRLQGAAGRSLGLDAAILAVLDRPDPRPPRPGGPRTADRQGEIRSEALLRPLQGERPGALPTTSAREI